MGDVKKKGVADGGTGAAKVRSNAGKVEMKRIGVKKRRGAGVIEAGGEGDVDVAGVAGVEDGEVLVEEVVPVEDGAGRKGVETGESFGRLEARPTLKVAEKTKGGMDARGAEKNGAEGAVDKKEESPKEEGTGKGVGAEKKGDEAGKGLEAEKKERRERMRRIAFERMVRKHVGGSLWLRARAPLLMALSDLAMVAGSTDSVRFRAIEKVEELLERAEDEKRRETFGSVSEGLEASVRRLEGALRRSARDRED